ncbi:hypothetical protein D770_26460 [Flammeovirgaceae bacterium 311]|nr:hypothetical protein D770_26460 [Flammeovirgaceae bacterium 311]
MNMQLMSSDLTGCRFSGLMFHLIYQIKAMRLPARNAERMNCPVSFRIKQYNNIYAFLLGFEKFIFYLIF